MERGLWRDLTTEYTESHGKGQRLTKREFNKETLSHGGGEKLELGNSLFS